MWQTRPTDLVVYKLDTLLNIVTSYSTSNGNWYAPNASAAFDNGDFVVGGIYVDAKDNENDFWQKKYLQKFDKNLNVIWTKYFGKRSLNTGITKLIITADENIVGTGIDGLKTDTVGMHISSCIFKFKANGDSLWLKNYQAIDNPIYGDENDLLDIDEMPDGGFIACGYAPEPTNGNLSRGWLMRVDANGCLDASCTDAVTEVDEQKALFVFPNPTNNILNISNPQNISSYQVNHLDGSCVYKGSGFPINFLELANGIYFINITHKNKRITTHKFIKN